MKQAIEGGLPGIDGSANMMPSAVHNPAVRPNQTLAPVDDRRAPCDLLAEDAHCVQSCSCATRVGQQKQKGGAQFKTGNTDAAAVFRTLRIDGPCWLLRAAGAGGRGGSW